MLQIFLFEKILWSSYPTGLSNVLKYTLNCLTSVTHFTYVTWSVTHFICAISTNHSRLCYISCHACLLLISCIGDCYLFPCRLLLLLSQQGTILDRSWRQLREYDSQASQVLPWLNSAEDTLAKYMAQPLKPDPTAIKQQISDLQVTSQYKAVYTKQYFNWTQLSRES